MALIGFNPVGASGANANAAPGSLGRLNRPPTPDDNTTKGYTSTSDLWQYNGVLYSPLVAPDSTGAGWDVKTEPACENGGLYDIANASGVTVAAAYGMYAVKSGYTGACFDYAATVAGGTVTGTINIVAGGELDQSAMSALFGSIDTGTYVRITKWYDQSGGAAHATQADGANSMYVMRDPMIGWCVCGETSTTSHRQLALPVGAPFTALTFRTISAHFVGRGVVAAGKTAPCFGALGVFAGNIIYFGNDYTSSPEAIKPTVSMWRTGENYKSPTTYCPNECGPCVVQFLPSASNSVYYVNENTGTNSSAPAATTISDGGFIGTSGVNVDRHASFRYAAVLFTKTTAMSTTVAAKIRKACYKRFDIKPQAKDLVVCFGDSRTQGYNAGAKETWPMAVASALKYPARVINMGSSGWTNASFTTGTPSTLGGCATLVNTTRKNIAVYWCGINDFYVSNLTAAQCFTAIATNVATLKAAGFYVILVNESATTDATNGTNTKLVTLRGLLQAGGHGADELLDLTVYNQWLDTTNFISGLHPLPALMQLLAAKVAQRVDLQLAQIQAL